MIGLLAASVWCWAIIVDKTLLIRRARRAMDRVRGRFLVRQFARGTLYNRSRRARRPAWPRCSSPRCANGSARCRTPASSFMGLQARIDKVLDVSIAREVEKLESNLLVLATVASAGPFIGLFGTVWGIMTSFRSIAASKNTSLAVVAPGIAEALFATAIGLFAAIPALIAYNKLQGDVAKTQARMEELRRRILRRSCRARSISTPAATARCVREATDGNGRFDTGGGTRADGARRGVPRYRAMADINMTPFIDVMLVLLDHLHGRGAPARDRRADRSAADQGRRAQYRPEAGRHRHRRQGRGLSDGPAGRRSISSSTSEGRRPRTVSTSASMCAARKP